MNPWLWGLGGPGRRFHRRVAQVEERVLWEHEVAGAEPVTPTNGGIVLAGTRPVCTRESGVRLSVPPHHTG